MISAKLGTKAFFGCTFGWRKDNLWRWRGLLHVMTFDMHR
jgi:hypothetical protein